MQLCKLGTEVTINGNNATITSIKKSGVKVTDVDNRTCNWTLREFEKILSNQKC